MRNLRVLNSVCAAAFLTCAACTTKPVTTAGASAPPAPLPREFRVKEQAIAELAAPSGISLTPTRLIKKGEGGNFIYPSSITSIETGTLYIADNNGHTIQYCPDKALSTTPFPASGNLRFPTTIRAWREHLFVADDEGIKVFTLDGKFERVLRTFYAIFNFTIADDGSIYANVSYRAPKDTDPLILKLDQDGKRVSGFGSRLNHLQFKGLDDNAYLLCSGQLLFAAFKHRPIVQVYDLKEQRLLREIVITHPIFAKLEDLAKDQTYTNPSSSRTALPRFTAGIIAIGNRLFVLLHLPYIEIVEVDFEGHERNRFHSIETTRVLDYFGFAARTSNSNNNLFDLGIAGVVNQADSPFLVEFTTTNAY